ncbi:MAG: TetR/AcrR family transcriptional regulator [Propionibacteriaceae bacterium]|nr:TetR/AcrR family transcriptional regulator [Propionibacteriaceae bacterium]
MPKIDAATVAEHRAQRERQVADAALDLLTGEGPSAVTPAAVAERAGLARTSVYQYAGSGAELVALAVEALFVQAEASLAGAVAAAGGDPEDRIEAIVRAVLIAAADGHSPHHAVEVERLPAAQRARLVDLHRRLMAPLEDAITDAGVADAATVAALAWGAINGVVPMLEHGAPVGVLVPLAVGFVRAGVRGSAAGGSVR